MTNSFKIAAFGNYDVLIELNLNTFSKYLKKANYSKYFVLVDENTAKHCLPILQNEVQNVELNIIEIKSGEQHKNFETLQYIIQRLIENQADRKALLINLGGGVICDMGAFAASVYKRGIDFIQMPTTLLAMVDASIGGKTGINFNSYKNQVGTFTNPQLVYANTQFLKTLPERQLKNGVAEMFKHGYLSGERLGSLDFVECITPSGNIASLIFKSIEFKNKIVTTDFNEKADRKQLNFGHTIGHAIESYSLMNDGSEALLHGEAIVKGFVIEAILSDIKFELNNSLVSRIYVDSLMIEETYKITKDKYDALIKMMKNDKKNNSGEIQFALLKDFGQPVWNVSVSETDIKTAFEVYNQLSKNAV